MISKYTYEMAQCLGLKIELKRVQSQKHTDPCSQIEQELRGRVHTVPPEAVMSHLFDGGIQPSVEPDLELCILLPAGLLQLRVHLQLRHAALHSLLESWNRPVGKCIGI